jgi:hypothetical protein
VLRVYAPAHAALDEVGGERCPVVRRRVSPNHGHRSGPSLSGWLLTCVTLCQWSTSTILPPCHLCFLLFSQHLPISSTSQRLCHHLRAFGIAICESSLMVSSLIQLYSSCPLLCLSQCIALVLWLLGLCGGQGDEIIAYGVMSLSYGGDSKRGLLSCYAKAKPRSSKWDDAQRWLSSSRTFDGDRHQSSCVDDRTLSSASQRVRHLWGTAAGRRGDDRDQARARL